MPKASQQLSYVNIQYHRKFQYLAIKTKEDFGSPKCRW